MTRIFDSTSQSALLKCGHTRDSTREDLALIIRETAQELWIEIIDHARFLEWICTLLRLISLLTKRRIDRIRIWC